MKDGLRSYSSPFNFGHKALEALFDGIVYAQEKVDGSQFSFGITEDGDLRARSRKQAIPVTPETGGMFQPALDTVLELAPLLTPGHTYRGEFLGKPKHNTIAYERVPKGTIILFDIDQGDQDYLFPVEVASEAIRLGLEVVPTLARYRDKPTLADLKALLDTDSLLGGVKIEGIVLKNYGQYGPDKKVLMGKYVSEAFKEKHGGDWKKRNPTQNDVVLQIIDEYSTEARWRKAIQHLMEQGEIEGVVQDIPVVLREVAKDIHDEDGEAIKERLFKHFWKHISRGVTRGLPEFYKAWLLEEFLGEE